MSIHTEQLYGIWSKRSYTPHLLLTRIIYAGLTNAKRVINSPGALVQMSALLLKNIISQWHYMSLYVGVLTLHS